MSPSMDFHHKVEGLTAEAAAGAHARDLEVQGAHRVNYLKYWSDRGTSRPRYRDTSEARQTC